MTDSNLFVSLSGACALAFALTIGCGGRDSTFDTAGGAGESAEGGSANDGTSTTHGGTSGGAGSTNAGGTSTTHGSAGSSNAGSSGTSTTHGGASSSAGSSNGGSGASSTAGSSAAGSSAGNGCSENTTEAACKAAGNCYPFYAAVLCPGSGEPCPTVFSSCANTGCGPTCGAGSVCVGESTEGGAVELPNDAGVCPQGSQLAGQICQRIPAESFSCKPAPAACKGTITCGCAASACNGVCESAAYNQIDCSPVVP